MTGVLDTAVLEGMATPTKQDGWPALERALVRAAQEDPSAFGTLYERYLDRVYAYLRARTRDAEDAADLTQQVFLQALAALPRFHDQKVPFAAWLFRIARNSAIDFHRRRRAAVTWDLLPASLQPVAAGDLEDQAMRDEIINHLRALVGRLDPGKREVLALRFAAGLTPGEIAAVIDKSEAATRKQLARTIQSLREELHDRTH